jgi:aconitase A
MSTPGDSSYRPPPHVEPNPDQEVIIDPNSNRLQLLKPFPAWNGQEFSNVRVLVRVQGKCTTDHISAAGPWLKYKGHLENIANNTLIGAVNADNGKVNSAVNAITGKEGTIPEVAREYLANNIPWMIVADVSSWEMALFHPLKLNILLSITMVKVRHANMLQCNHVISAVS